MKKFLSFVIFLIFAISLLSAKSKTIENPYYEFKSTGIQSVSKIELSKTDTRIHIHNTFLPNWWVMFDSTEVITDVASKKVYKVIDIEGAEFGKRLFMPASADSTIVLVFPPLEKGVSNIDYSSKIFGISLNSKGSASEEEIPREVKEWLDKEHVSNTKNNLESFDSPDFYSTDTARLIGYIKGYDVRARFSTGIIYTDNLFTREDYPTVVKVHPDGRFEANVPLLYPARTYMSINNKNIDFYLEPGQTLSIMLDWDEYLLADRYRNIRYEFRNIKFRGNLSMINEELNKVDIKQPSYKVLQKRIETHTPDDYYKEQQELLYTQMESLKASKDSLGLSPLSYEILNNELILERGVRLLNFVSRRGRAAKKDTANQVLNAPVEDDYYSFLKGFPLNKNSILINDRFGTFINRFEYCDLFKSNRRSRTISVTPDKSFMDYLHDLNIKITPEEEEVLAIVSNRTKTKQEIQQFEQQKNKIDSINNKYKDLKRSYSEKYILPTQNRSMIKTNIERWRKKDSIALIRLGGDGDLVYEISKIRALNFETNSLSRDYAFEYWDQFQKGFNNEILVQIGDRFMISKFPDTDITSYELPKGVATDIFKKIIDPHKGKILFVDFWATSCSPCVGGIKRMKENREKYKDNENIDFIFITDEKSSPVAKYDKFVEEQELSNSHRISKDDYNYLRQLFKFNGIPRYALIDKDGKVLDDDYKMYRFKYEIDNILKEQMGN